MRTPTESPSQLSRRSMLTLTAASVAGVAASTPSFASERVASDGPSTQVGTIKSNEYWVEEGTVRLYMYRKRLVSTVATRPKPVLFLAHGSSVSSVPSFDLKVPGHDDFSMMDYFAQSGFDVWTMDFEGYGRSSRTGGNNDIARAVENMRLAIPLVQKESGQKKFHYFGESAGALRVGVYAQQFPEQVERLGLASLSYTGVGSPTLAKRKETLPFLSTHDRRPRDREMILSIFTRDKLGTYDPAVPDALADMELKIPGSSDVPTGSYVDMTTKLPMLDPKRAIVPVILIRGEDDGIATEDDVMNYFRNVATSDREFRLIPRATHAVGWGNKRLIAWQALCNFLQSSS